MYFMGSKWMFIGFRVFICLLILFTIQVKGDDIDSLRTEKIDGQWYIIHQVDPQETLFSLYRRYGTNVADIIKANPGSGEGIQIGQELRIPITAPANGVQISNNQLATPQNGPVRTDGRGDVKNHTVVPGETLYSISRQYNVSVDEIKALNNLSSNEISIGQTLRITDQPSRVELPVAEGTKKNTASVHTVKPGETLYSIARNYGVTPEDLKQWNNLGDAAISIGQQLRTGPGVMPAGNANTVEIVPQPEEIKEVTVTQSRPRKDTVEHDFNETSVRMQEQMVEITRRIEENSTATKVIETGLAEVIEGSGETVKYLALHRTAEVGTIIEVKNDLNDTRVFVRVIGRIPDNGVNDKVVIKISQQAYKKLGGGLNNRFPCEISYYP